jgi:hypothetical protein
MPRYFFHLYNDFDVPDPEGEELLDDDAARERALVGVRELMAAISAEGRKPDLTHRIEVEDEQGTRLFTVTFSDAVAVRRSISANNAVSCSATPLE